ncbi:meiosis-specific coiled-coil domain-containing protein MEIOC-like isoform X3 [Crotalus tigris]|uniref:meiosis-specific coiled-coil domain-containing protein MEIOC-like isoform X3 n=1 Tax=Crotalus tigris TaxID=88082 RepID=UPI00192F2B84|nr:meiosis-specific coiled-coil domain-containing protein MEIOC-like isoform X3 [Crotalus tigris]
MSAPFFGERTNTPFAVEYPQLSNSSLRCEDGGRMGTSLQKRSDQWTQIKLSYSANGPDMFALVTSILQEPNEPEAIADWDPLSKLFPPSWTMNLENNSRYSRLFPTKIWDHENHTNVVDAQSSYEEKWGEASPTEQLSRQLSDLQTQADLAKAFPENSFASSEEILLSPLPARPSRVDRLIWIQFQERATVCTLLGKMEHLCDVSIHSRISATLGRHLEAIHTTQARRKDEILNASNQRPGTSCVTMEKDILALASAVNELTSSTRKTRTTLWCAFQTALPKTLTGNSDLASIPLQTKILRKGEDKENERVN